MFAIVLLLSFFIQLSASDLLVISVEEFLRSFGTKFRSEAHFERDFEYTPLQSHPTENLITVHARKFGAMAGEPVVHPDLLTMCLHRFTGKPEETFITFKVHDPCGILIRDGKFAPALCDSEGIVWYNDIAMCRAKKGTRPVGIYSCGDIKVCFKQWPEAPGIEIAAYQLYKALFQTKHEELPIPPSEVILINGQVFLVSEFMDGEPLDGVLSTVYRDPTLVSEYTLNLEISQRLAIFFLLTVPEDCHADNFLVIKVKGSSQYKLGVIDNDRSFGRVVTEKYYRDT